MNQKSFIVKNEQDVNVIATNILLWAALVAFPSLFILTLAGIFEIDLKMLSLFAAFGIIFAALPFIMRRLKMNSSLIKYMTILMSTVVVGMLATNQRIGINLVYLFPVGLSCLYFDKKLTWTSFGLGVMGLFVSRYFRFVEQLGTDDFNTVMAAYVPTIAGYAVEFLTLSLIFIMLARRTRNLLESLTGSEEQAELLERLRDVMGKSTKASDTLAESLKQLSKTMEDTTGSNDVIATNASKAADECEKNLEYIENTTATVQRISNTLETISLQTRDMVDVSTETYEAAEENEKAIRSAVENMEQIEVSSKESKELVNRLGEQSEQIGRIIEIITSIAGQTNLLALNAAIESARAGEQGKGFAVVAEEIRKLAEQSEKAAKDISNLIKSIQHDTSNAISSIDKGTDIIKNGIGLVRNAGSTFEKLRDLQKNTNDKVGEIAASSVETSGYSKKIMDIVVHIEKLTRQSMQEIEAIALSTQQQSASMQEISASFDVIDNIALELQSSSRSV